MPRPTFVPNNTEQPSKADVVVIGGGIAGIATAMELVERGMQVALFEKGSVAAEQSSRNWGWVRQMGRDPRELPLMGVSMDIWRNMQQHVGDDVGFRECGIAYLCETERELAKRQQWFDSHANAHGLTSRMLSSAQARSLAPQAMRTWRGGLYTPDDACAEPTLAVPAMARAAQRAGVKIFQNCAARCLVRSGGKISGVVTQHGEVRSNAVVLAGGAWSRRFCHNADIELPQLSVVGSVLRTSSIDAGLVPSMAARNFAIRKRLDGGFTIANPASSIADVTPDSFRLFPQFWPLLKDEWRDFRYQLGERFLSEARIKRRWNADEISPFEQVSVLDLQPNQTVLNTALRSLRQIFPIFQTATIVEEWSGVIDVTPDAIPVISPVAGADGFYLITGFSGHGFGLGPGAGRLLAQLVTGETPCVDPAPFRLERFAAVHI